MNKDQDKIENIKSIEDKRNKWIKKVQNFPNFFKPTHHANDLHQEYGHLSKQEIEQNREKKENQKIAIAGRVMSKRLMGKIAFLTIKDSIQHTKHNIQIVLSKNNLSKQDDHSNYGYLIENILTNDIVGVQGYVTKTNKQELSILADEVHILSKSKHPAPDKQKGVQDKHIKYSQRHLDLIFNANSHMPFIMRSKMISTLRKILEDEGYIEVETPMMHPIPGGANAKPFITHHNELNMGLYLRISPELYLKRLIVAGFTRIFELNRNFRNEGISANHNPEFTALELYKAYSDYKEMMDFTETLIKKLVKNLLNTSVIEYQNTEIDFNKPFLRISMQDAILSDEIQRPERFSMVQMTKEDLNSKDRAIKIASKLGIEIQNSWGLGKIISTIFEETTEKFLIKPTFITDHPKEISTLARTSNDNKEVTERFELYIDGKEIANGFSELNDPEDQSERFAKQAQAKEDGDEEAMFYDADYIACLEHAMPPTAGLGIGIDRLAMLLTNQKSIKDVILFPTLRPTMRPNDK